MSRQVARTQGNGNTVAQTTVTPVDPTVPANPGAYDPSRGSLTNQMLMDPALNERVWQQVNAFANSNSAPPHVRGNAGLCLWAVEVSLNTGLPAMTLFNGCFAPGGGKIGMTAELCLAILQAGGAIKGEPIWHEVGDWSKVRQKFKIIKKTKDGKETKFAVPDYEPKDEQGLGVRVTIHWADRKEPVTYPESKLPDGSNDAYWMSDRFPRHSTLWATNPLQQTKNAVLRLICRTVRPAALAGMIIADEDDVHIGPDNAKVIDQTPDEALDDMAGDDFDMDDDDAVLDGAYQPEDTVDDGPPAGFFDDEGSDASPPPPQTQPEQVKLWLSFKEPAKAVAKRAAGKVLFEAYQGAENMDHLIALANNNANVILSLPKASQDKLKAAQEDKATSLG